MGQPFRSGIASSSPTQRSSSFSSVAPEAFGFLGTTRGTVVVNSGAQLKQRGLRPLSIVAGDIEIRGSVETQSGDIRCRSTCNRNRITSSGLEW